MRGLVTMGALLSLGGATGACLDVSPIEVDVADTSAPLPDTRPSEGGSDDADGAPVDARTPCQDCIESLCAADYGKCHSYPKCDGTYLCSLAKGCFKFADFKAVIDCGIPCAEASGLVDQTSVEAVAIVSVVACMQDKCAAVCVGK
jgi:hypothetical protein